MKKRYTIITISLVCTAVVLLAAAAILLFAPPGGNSTAAEGTTTVISGTAAGGADITATEEDVFITESPREETTAELQEAPTEEAEEVTAPDNMMTVLEQDGNSLQTLTDLGCRQLVTVASSGSSATIRYFSLDNGQWTEDEDLSCSGYVGRNGVTSNMQEGGNASPMGLYHIGDAFYQYDKPATGLNTFEITYDTYWVDDPGSSHYNQRVVGTGDMDWNSAEAMAQIANYKYGFVIDYNTEGVPGAGSAIFFHLSSGPTAGCIGTDESHVLGYLQKLDAAQNPYIVIV